MIVVDGGRQSPGVRFWSSTLSWLWPLAGLNAPVKPAAVHALRAAENVKPMRLGTVWQAGVGSGVGLGVAVGFGVGTGVGAGVGVAVGTAVGGAVGVNVGVAVEPAVGGGVRPAVGSAVWSGPPGAAVGPATGPGAVVPLGVVGPCDPDEATGPLDTSDVDEVGVAVAPDSAPETSPSTPPVGRNATPMLRSSRARASTIVPAANGPRRSRGRGLAASERGFAAGAAGEPSDAMGANSAHAGAAGSGAAGSGAAGSGAADELDTEAAAGAGASIASAAELTPTVAGVVGGTGTCAGPVAVAGAGTTSDDVGPDDIAAAVAATAAAAAAFFFFRGATDAAVYETPHTGQASPAPAQHQRQA